MTAAVDEDETGITITREWVEDGSLSGLFVAVALGRFAGSDLARPRFLARDLLRQRLARTEHRAGGWTTLARTTAADVADHLWNRREEFLSLLDALPQVPQHGDPSHANVPGRSGDEAVAIDWATLGTGPVGGDLGFFALTAREEFEPLLDAYLMGLPDGVAAPDDVLLGRPDHRGLHGVRARRVGAGPGRAAARARWPGSSGTPPWRRTCGRCSASAPTSRRCSAGSRLAPGLRPCRRRRCRRPRPSPGRSRS